MHRRTLQHCSLAKPRSSLDLSSGERLRVSDGFRGLNKSLGLGFCA